MTTTCAWISWKIRACRQKLEWKIWVENLWLPIPFWKYTSQNSGLNWWYHKPYPSVYSTPCYLALVSLHFLACHVSKKWTSECLFMSWMNTLTSNSKMLDHLPDESYGKVTRLQSTSTTGSVSMQRDRKTQVSVRWSKWHWEMVHPQTSLWMTRTCNVFVCMIFLSQIACNP